VTITDHSAALTLRNTDANPDVTISPTAGDAYVYTGLDPDLHYSLTALRTVTTTTTSSGSSDTSYDEGRVQIDLQWNPGTNTFTITMTRPPSGS
jgi:hypothetical protein